MKFLVLGLLVSSFSSFATTLDLAVSDASYELSQGPVTGEEAANIIKAINNHLRDIEFKCTGNHNYHDMMRNIPNLFNNPKWDSVVSINESSPQPLILFTAKSGSSECSYEFVTSKDQKQIEKIVATIASVSEVEINTGTILKPRFVTVQKKIINYSINCTLK
jgi:hypothetical protein